MKNTYLAACVIALASCSHDKTGSGFELKGHFDNASGQTIYLEKLAGAQPVVVDSATLDENGNFSFNDYTPRIGFYRIKENAQNFAMLVLDSADKVEVTGNFKDLGNTYKVNGSDETNLFMQFNDMAKQRDLRLDSLNREFQAKMESTRNDKARIDSLSKQFEAPYNAIVAATNDKVAEKIKANSDKFACIMAIQALEPDQYRDTYKALDKGLSSKYPEERNVKMFHEVVMRMLASTVGSEAPEIDLPSPDGKNIALSSLRGKVVLIDFWASWCGPCRKEMPNVVKAYDKFKSKGFEIYGVSLDNNRERWVEAIKADGITWPQVSDLKYWESEPARLYNVQGIPYTVLLDRQGHIIAKNLRGEALEQKLSEVLQ